MKQILLENGMLLAIDEEDAHLVENRKCRVFERGCRWYVTCGGVNLHRLIMPAPKGMMTDHINGNILDARRCNLRIVTPQQNQWNKKPGRKHRVKGVFKMPRTEPPKYIVQITCDSKTKYVGAFPTEKQAARAYDAKAIEIQGEYARLNFPDGYEDILPDHLIERFRAEKRGFVKRPEDYQNV